MTTVSVVDYGMGNLDSVRRALEECGARANIIADPKGLDGADRIVLPGVGAFAQGMTNLRARGFEEPLRDLVIQGGVPTLGICLGMQLLATRGIESGESRGLGWIPGDVVRLEPGLGERVPHVGWNDVDAQVCHPLLEGLPNHPNFYFVHSYHLRCASDADVIAKTPYCGGFASVVGHGRLVGVQFHPEKSQKTGFALIRNFLERV